MPDPAGGVFLLNSSARRDRRRRADLLHFLEALGLQLQAGFDLGYAWPHTCEMLGPFLAPETAASLAPGGGNSLAVQLRRLALTYPDVGHRVWFAALAELYGEGCGMADAVYAVAGALRGEHERDFEVHCRRLPGTANIYLLLFFLPPALFLLFAPLLFELSRGF